MSVRIDDLINLRDARQGRDKHASKTILQDTFHQIERLAQDLGFLEIYLMKSSEIVTGRWVRLKCRYGCAKYNTSWCCPPAAPNLQMTRDILEEYDFALLLVSENTNEHFYRNSSDKRRVQIKQWKSTVALERKLFLMGYYKAFGLPSDTCALCKECAYPKQCRFPNEKRPTLEACGIDVFQTVKNLGKSTGLVRKIQDCFYCYSLILLS
ncbi:MAG: DUF2284 domain-containing protein [Desulfomonilaceae bacterium]